MQQLLDLSKQGSALCDFCLRLLDDAKVSFFYRSRLLNKGLRSSDGRFHTDEDPEREEDHRTTRASAEWNIYLRCSVPLMTDFLFCKI